MLEDDKPRRLGSGEPLGERRVNASGGSAALLADAPVLSAAKRLEQIINTRAKLKWRLRHLLLVPNDGVQAEYLLCNSTHTVVRVTIGRSPVFGQASTRRVMNDLHRPAEFSEQLLVRQRGHVGVRPGVHGNVVVELLEGPEELLRVVEDVDTDEEVGRMDLVLLQEVVQPVGRLYAANKVQMSISAPSRIDVNSITYRQRTIVEAGAKNTVRGIPGIVILPAFVRRRADLVAQRVKGTVRRITASGSRRRERRYLPGRHSCVESIDPLLREFGRVRLCLGVVGCPL